MATKAQTAALGRILKAVNKKFGKDASMVPGKVGGRVEAAIPSGVAVLDRYLIGAQARDGSWGLPRGKIAEVYGDTGVGKTTLAYKYAAENQKIGGLVQWVDSEQSFDAERFAQLGGDPDALLLTQPENLEQALGVLREVNGAVGPKDKLLSIWDSIATSPMLEELTKDYDVGVSMSRGALIGRGCRDLMKLARKNQTTVILVNQIREKIGVKFGSPITTPGGKGPKFAASIRLWLMGGSAVEAGDEKTGKDVVFLMEKNRFAPPLRKARIRLLYASGWDSDWSTVSHAKDKEVIAKDEKFSKALVLTAEEHLGWLEQAAEKRLAK